MSTKVLPPAINKILAKKGFKRLLLLVSFLIGFIINLISVQTISPNLPMQNYDTTAHLAFIRGIIESGDFSPFHLVQNAGSEGGFYPNLFHILAVVIIKITACDIVSAVFITWIIGAFIIWPISITFLVWVLTKKSNLYIPVLITPLLSTVFTTFPLLLLQWGTLYPFGLAYAFLPLLVAVSFGFLQSLTTKTSTKIGLLTWGSGILICGLLVCWAQPRSLITYLAVMFPLVITMWWKNRKNSHFVKWVFPICLGVVFILGSIYATKQYGELLLHPEKWPGAKANLSLWQGVYNWVSNTVTIWPSWVLLTNFLLFGVLIISIATCLVLKQQRWLIVSWSFLGVVFLWSACSDWWIAKIFSGAWYKDEQRLLAATPLVLIPLIAITFGIISSRGKIFFTASLCVLLLLVLVNPPRSQLVNIIKTTQSLNQTTSGFDQASKQNTQSLLTHEKQKLMQNVADFVPDNQAVLADPWAGGSFLYSIYGQKVMFTTLKDNVSQIRRQAIEGLSKGSIQALCNFSMPNTKNTNDINSNNIAVRWFLDLGPVWRTNDKSHLFFAVLHKVDLFKTHLKKTHISGLYHIECDK